MKAPSSVAAALWGLAFLSCVQTQVVTRDYTSGLFTVCGNGYAAADDLKAQAATVCQGTTTPQLLRCSGGYYGTCCEYACPAVQTPAKGAAPTESPAAPTSASVPPRPASE